MFNKIGVGYNKVQNHCKEKPLGYILIGLIFTIFGTRWIIDFIVGFNNIVSSFIYYDLYKSNIDSNIVTLLILSLTFLVLKSTMDYISSTKEAIILLTLMVTTICIMYIIGLGFVSNNNITSRIEILLPFINNEEYKDIKEMHYKINSKNKYQETLNYLNNLIDNKISN